MTRSFWDNLIPIRRGLTGEQYAGWQPRRLAQTGLGCRLFADQRIPVDDGVTLSADVYVPQAPGKYPAIVQFAAYSRELHTAGVPSGNNEIGSPPVFTDRGYAPVVVTRRGMGQSDGEAGIFFNSQDVDDHERCIAWAAAQPWCDGRVVMFGTSYYGMTQVQVAVRRPPALQAFFCNEICTDYVRQIMRFGGTFNSFFLSLWLGANFTRTQYRLKVPPVIRAALSWVTGALQPLMRAFLRRRIDLIFAGFMRKTPIRSVREWYANWMVDGQTRERILIPEGPYRTLDQIEVPLVVVQGLGFFNVHQFGGYDLFANAGTPPDRKWIILNRPHYQLPVFDWQLEALAFFDYVLHTTDNGYAEQPRVRYWLNGAERYAGAEDFPVPGGTPLRLYLASSGTDALTHRLNTKPPAEGGQNSWAAIPFGALVPGGLDEVVNQTLIYDLRATEPMRLVGPITARLRFGCNEIDSHIVARIGRVSADGAYHLLSMGTISPARRRIDRERSNTCEIAHQIGAVEPLLPGTPVDLTFSLTPSATELCAGEVLRFEVASRTDLLKSDPGHGYVHFNLPVPPYFSRNTLHYGPDTHIELHRIRDA